MKTCERQKFRENISLVPDQWPIRRHKTPDIQVHPENLTLHILEFNVFTQAGLKADIRPADAEVGLRVTNGRFDEPGKCRVPGVERTLGSRFGRSFHFRDQPFGFLQEPVQRLAVRLGGMCVMAVLQHVPVAQRCARSRRPAMHAAALLAEDGG